MKDKAAYQAAASELAKDCIVTQALGRFLEQVLEEIYETRIKPLEIERAAALAKIEIDEKRFLLAWDALDAVIRYFIANDRPVPALFQQVNTAKHGISGRAPLEEQKP
jgi:hypothetical protein